jgi:STAS domain
MEAISVIDITGLEALEEVRSELAGKGIAFAVARAKGELARTSGPRGLLGTNRCGELLSVDTKRGSVCVESVS